MEDAEGGLSFDFEGGLDGPAALGPFRPSAGVAPAPSGPRHSEPAAALFESGTGPGGAYHSQGGRRSFRQTVCRHWLRGLCMKGDACGFLHQYDKDRMPVCRFFRMYGECREQDCPYKHTTEDIKECNMYKLGFCPNGADCRYKHAKLPGPPPPVEEVFQKLQQMNPSFAPSGRYFHPRNVGYSQQGDKPQIPSVPMAVSQINQTKPVAPSGPSIQLSQQQLPPQPPQQQQPLQQGQQISQTQSTVPQNGSSPPVRTALPLPQGQSRYFIVKSCNRENLELSVQQGVWATQRSNEAKLNEAFDSSQNVILIFSINRTRHFQGCAKMMSRIGGFFGGGNWKHAHGTAHYGRNFSIKWLKLGELSFYKTRHLRNPYNENLPVKISRDCQELEPSIGEQLASLLYLEPDSELMAMLIAAESKREEEKAKGMEVEDTAENPDIVPFEDEEEEEESDEEEDATGPAALARARERGLMWPPHLSMGRGVQPMMGLRGFPPMMMGAEGFGYDQFNPPFFQPFPGARFPGMAQQPPVFPGMIMGGGARPPFMAAPGMGLGRGLRPIGGPPLLRPLPPPASSTGSRGLKRDPRWSASEMNEKHDGGSDHGSKSDSGDEGSRRSRHGEGKRRRRGGDAEASDQWEVSS